ncbi:hypothetical protein Chro_5716 (plasmid) [Chroococcidiopsis thermalis PCC 7203]|uniref:Uncharacterized protein n=1 Tax=Chroococcidiopsis thermalis (strain PCC 7203) TaxID=251229 RepID=K9U9Y8_CHRTP|nr:hypothetical protein Chro_5716 [Chroococcidiopsis thermalis PCC 7203]
METDDFFCATDGWKPPPLTFEALLFFQVKSIHLFLSFLTVLRILT